MLFTQDANLIKALPGERSSSLVADTINRLERYGLRVKSYSHPLSAAQSAKKTLANDTIRSLKALLLTERELASSDHEGHEALRRQVIAIIGDCRNANRLIATNPIVSEGSLGTLLYEAHKAAQHYEFNRFFAVSRLDQMDFSEVKPPSLASTKPSLVWDSELHVGQNNHDLNDVIRILCDHYDLVPAEALSHTPANRFKKLEFFFQKLWRDGRDWVDYLAVSIKPAHKTETITQPDGVSITRISPYYRLTGLEQKGYENFRCMLQAITDIAAEPLLAEEMPQARERLLEAENGCWVVLEKQNTLLYRKDNAICSLRYFSNDNRIYPLPAGDDLYTLSQISKRHLYLPERVRLSLFAFASRIPVFFSSFYRSMRHFIVQDLHHEFMNHVHTNHESQKKNPPEQHKRKQNTLHRILQQQGQLANGQTLEEYIVTHLQNSPYVIARATHPPSPPVYENPFHKLLGVIRHLAGFFVDANERNPIIGSLATAAYFYGAGAVLAPDALEKLLRKLQLNGLIAGIEPTQKMAHAMSHGPLSESISAAMTYWQAIIISGNLDQFFIEAVTVLKEDPAEVAIILALALSLGYGMTKAIPSLEDEMGSFPIPNYLALGAKGGAALYDTIMHPGDDWLLGTCKWVAKYLVTLGKIWVAPFFEGYYFGYEAGFKNGLRKSLLLSRQVIKQSLAASADFLLCLASIPLLELASLLIHVPFRGFTNLLANLLAACGNLKEIGGSLLYFAKKQAKKNYFRDFRISPLYGLPVLVMPFSQQPTLNFMMNLFRWLWLIPLELIKNLLLLPVLDALSLSARAGITALSVTASLMGFLLGLVLDKSGRVWDSSLGRVFSFAAISVISAANFVDQQASSFKQRRLSDLEITRGKLFHWGFATEERLTIPELEDKDYYQADPSRLEKIPHSNSHCLLHSLLTSSEPAAMAAAPNPAVYNTLFVPSKEAERSPKPLYPFDI